jgi:ribosomal protein S18 acetylase RimI-like enzyme
MSTKSLYLKELYVSLSHRRSGIGRILMAHICNVALESECSRVEWTTDQDNRDAQKFYEGLGIHALPSKMFYRAEGDALRTVALSLRP